MTEVHEDWGELYKFSDHKKGDHINYRLEGHTERGEILWVACGGTLPSGREMPPHYIVYPERGGWPDSVLFSDVVMGESSDTEPALVKCPYCPDHHPAGMIEQCPRKPS